MSSTASKEGSDTKAKTKAFTIEVDTRAKTITADGRTRTLGSIPMGDKNKWEAVGLTMTKRRDDGYVALTFRGRAFELIVDGTKREMNEDTAEFHGA